MKLALAKKARLVRRKSSGSLLVVWPERALELDPDAAAIAVLIDGSRTETEIVDAISERHDAPRASIERGVARFVAALGERRLLEGPP